MAIRPQRWRFKVGAGTFAICSAATMLIGLFTGRAIAEVAGLPAELLSVATGFGSGIAVLFFGLRYMQTRDQLYAAALLKQIDKIGENTTATKMLDSKVGENTLATAALERSVSRLCDKIDGRK